MKTLTHHLLIMLTVLSTGCTTSRQPIANHDTTPQLIQSENDTGDENSPRVIEPHSTVSTVAYHIDKSDGSTDGNTSDQVVRLDLPVEVKSERGYIESSMSEGITLEVIEQIALANNPSIQQASAASARAGGIRTQVGLKPNPTIGYSGVQLGDAGTDQHSLFVEQTFVRGDKLEWNQQVLNHDVNAMNWQVETQRQRLRTDIRLAFYEALAAQKRLQLAQEFREVSAKGVTISEERLKAEVGTRPDVLQSEIQLNEVDIAIQQAEFDYSAAWNELAALSGLVHLAETRLIGELDSDQSQRDAESEFAKIEATSPLLAMAQARVDRARSNLQRQRAQPISNVTAQLGVGHDNGTGEKFANVQFSLPLPLRNKNQGNIAAAHAEYCGATQNVERIRMSIRRDLARVMREYQVAEVTVRQYEFTILPKAKEALELMQTAQAAGEFDFLRVLTARRAYFDSNIKYVTALGQLAQANSKIDGLLLTGGLAEISAYEGDDGLRGQALSGE